MSTMRTIAVRSWLASLALSLPNSKLSLHRHGTETHSLVYRHTHTHAHAHTHTHTHSTISGFNVKDTSLPSLSPTALSPSLFPSLSPSLPSPSLPSSPPSFSSSSSLPPSPPSHRDPLAQFDVEKREHEMKMKKMEQEMEEVFEMKVQEKL